MLYEFFKYLNGMYLLQKHSPLSSLFWIYSFNRTNKIQGLNCFKDSVASVLFALESGSLQSRGKLFGDLVDLISLACLGKRELLPYSVMFIISRARGVHCARHSQRRSEKRWTVWQGPGVSQRKTRSQGDAVSWWMRCWAVHGIGICKWKKSAWGFIQWILKWGKVVCHQKYYSKTLYF